MDFQVIVNQMIQIFLLISLGYILFKINILNIDFNKQLSNLLISVTMPCLIMSSILTLEEVQSLSEIAFVFLIAIITYLVLPVIGLVLNCILAIPKQDRNLYLFMHIFSNVAFMGFAVISSIFGAQGLFYTVIFNIVFNLFVFSFGQSLFSKPTNAIKQFCSPVIVVSIISIICYVCQVTLPFAIVDSAASIGSMTTSIAMLVLGASLAQIPIREVFNNIKIYIYSFIRQVLLPIACYPILSFCITDPLLRGVVFVIIAMPIANIGVIFATQYDGNVQEMSKCVFMSTLFSIVSIPFLVQLFLM